MAGFKFAFCKEVVVFFVTIGLDGPMAGLPPRLDFPKLPTEEIGVLPALASDNCN